MAETLGSLSDKLTIVKLKQWHTDDAVRQNSLLNQEKQLKDEMDEFVSAALDGQIPPERLTFASNKVYDRSRIQMDDVSGTIGKVFAELAGVNCDLWHEQEKVYNFEAISDDDKRELIGRLSSLNLKRNQCIDAIDAAFCTAIAKR